MIKVFLAFLSIICLSSCTLDSITIGTGHIPSYYREVRPIYRTYYYDLRPDYIRYRYGRPRRIHYRY